MLPPGSKKSRATNAPLLATVLLTVSLAFVTILSYQVRQVEGESKRTTGAASAGGEQAVKNGIMAQLMEHQAKLDSLQQAVKAMELKLTAGSQTWDQIVNSIEHLQDIEQGWGDDLEALLSRFRAIETAQQMQRVTGEKRVEAQHGLCRKSTTIFAKPPPFIDLPFSADTQGWGVMDNAAFASFKLQPNFTAPSAQGDRNVSIYVYADSDIVSHFILQSRSWETSLIQGVVDQLYKFAQEKGLKHEEVYFLDIGGNIGTFSLAAAAHGFSVITFEPMLSNRMAFQLSLCANPGLEERITLIGKGLGNASTICDLYSIRMNQGNGFVRCGEQSNVPEGVPKRATLEVVRLDEELRSSIPRLQGRVGAVKMDVEGYEPQVFAGAREFFKTVAPPYITTECDTTTLHDASGATPVEFFTQIHGLGYTVRDRSFQTIPVESFADFHGCDKNINVFFTREKHSTTEARPAH